MRVIELAVLFLITLSIVDARKISHANHVTHKASHGVLHAKDLKLKSHKNELDLSKSVVEVPEQTLEESKPSHHDFEEEDNDDFESTKVVEVPEQTLEEDSTSNIQTDQSKTSDNDLEVLNDGALKDIDEDALARAYENSHEPLPPTIIDEDEMADFQIPQQQSVEVHHQVVEVHHPQVVEVQHPQVVEVHHHVVEHPQQPAPVKKGNVHSDQPRNGKKILPSTFFSPDSLKLGDGLGDDFVNPLLMAHNPPLKPIEGSEQKFNSRASSDLQFSSGNYRFSVHQSHAKNFLDASRIQVGTSELGAHAIGQGQSAVAKFRIKFHDCFTTRPMVIVTTVPKFADDVDRNGPHPDVFAASVSQISLDSFIVNVVRVDSFPSNGWGQILYLDWIAMEYPNQKPSPVDPTYVSDWLPTKPAIPAI